MNRPIKIVVIGPESTGKSTLCEQLADHYATAWVPEYAREYLLTHGKEYTYDDLLIIAKGQVALEEKVSGEWAVVSGIALSPGLFQKYSQLPTHHSPPLFIDTDLYVMKVWSEFVFGKCDPWILDQIVARRYDGYLLCRTDLPWAPEELREYPDPATREKLFHIYKDCLINQSTPWAEISGLAEDRLAMAIAAVGKLIA